MLDFLTHLFHTSNDNAQDTLQRANADLEKRVQDRNADLAHAHAALQAEITQRQRVEEDLRKQRAQLRITLDSIGDGVIVTDAEGRLTSLNPVAQQVSGWGEEAIGKSLADVFTIVNERTRQPVENPVTRALREGRVVALANHTILIAKDGKERPIDDSAAPIRDEQGNVMGAVLVFRDVTERRHADDARFRRLNELGEADRRKNEFLATLAHELRNPLAPIRNALHILKQPAADCAVSERMREMMERQVRHMTRMVDDLLDVSRITRGKIELRKEIVDLASVVNRTVEAIRPFIEDRHLDLAVTLPPGPVRLEADPTRLEQILTNLLNNAAKYTDPGGHVWVTVQWEADNIVLRVKDTGMGIGANMLTRIFELFVQSERGQHHTSQGGLGIGLTLVRSLVEMHGGTVEAHSDGLRKGSEFVVRLPALVPEQPNGLAKGAGAVLPPAQAKAKRRILVVDDNVDAAESLAMLLRLAGHDVRVAHDGPAALDAVHADPPDIMFLDIGMPVMNGYEVAEQLRQQSGLENLQLVAVTGWGQDEDRRRSEEAGFDHHMVKPVEPEALYQLLAGSKA